MTCALSGRPDGDLDTNLKSETLGLTVHVRISSTTFREVHHAGGLDQWLRNTPRDRMTVKAKRLRAEINRR